ncbi:MAG: phosphate transport system regulatory protein PhoU [Melioribacteraceae bacterium]|nr:MAG: phosphate transport system regulatory protein PhoU [Melioribacteraceae bacterium]
MERPFDIQIEKLKTKLIKMCSLVDEQVEFAIKALETEDSDLASFVVERDAKVDKYDVKIEKICQRLFALNQPVAMDLRLIMSALKINANLERVGDLAVSIARNVIDIGNKPEFHSTLHFTAISQVTRDMIKKAIDSFINNDSELAKTVLNDEGRLDSMVDEDTAALVEIMKASPDNVSPGLYYFDIFQSLERLGDHATNISEEVYFIVKAQLIKHHQLED